MCRNVMLVVGDVHRFLAAVAKDNHRNTVARMLMDEFHEFRFAADRATVDRDDHVAARRPLSKNTLLCSMVLIVKPRPVATPK